MRFLLPGILGLVSSISHCDSPNFPQKLPHGNTERFVLREQLGTKRASGVLLDWNTGAVLGSTGRQDAVTPGSLLKPFLLAYALRHDLVKADTRIYCRRSLRIGGHSLACTHPAEMPLLDAESALAASCNTWFASLAQRMTAKDMEAALRQAGFPIGNRQADNADSRVLTALGLQNIAVTPAQVAAAYRGLLRNEARTGTVWNGLRGSVAWGMAGNARVGGVEVLGKTGTANTPGQWWTHGWFAGGVPGRFILVVYVPRGDGGTAATLAGVVLRRLLHKDAR